MNFTYYPRLEKKIENTTFRKPDLFPYSGEGRETPTLLGPLERVKLIHWTKSMRPTIPSVTHRSQNPLES
jgi:hypothetical protein